MAKSDRWIEKDKKLLERPRKARLVTYLDLQDENFVKKHPNAEIGQEIPDCKPLFWKTGLVRKPTLEQQHALIAAQFRRELEQEIELDQEDSLLDDDFDDNPMLSQYEAAGVLYDGIPEQLASTSEDGASAPQNAGEASSSSERSSEKKDDDDD